MTRRPLPPGALAQIRRAERARDFPVNTCPESRHMQMVGEMLAVGRPHPMIAEEPEHVGLSLLAVVESLWKARTALRRLGRDGRGRMLKEVRT